MPTLPMQRLDAKPPRWRSLFAPGGCEFFEIKIPASDFLLQIGIGNPYSQSYRRRDRRYRRRPTRNPPALPAEYPFALLRYRGELSLLDAQGSPLQCDDTPAIQLGPARITWAGNEISASWDEPPSVSFRAQTVSPISTTLTSGGAVHEMSRLAIHPGPFSEAEGTISHILISHLTAEAAAHYLQSISRS